MVHIISVVVLALATFVSSTAAADMMRPMPANGVRASAIFGSDDRSTLRARSHAFIVKLLDGHGRFVCTGAVVAGHTILSAAHCTGYSGGEFPRSRSIRFVETVDGTRYRVNCSSVSPEFEGVTYPGGLLHISDVTPDISLVTTHDRIAAETGTVAVSRNLNDGDRVVLAGYHSDAPGVLLGQSCVAHRYGSVWVYDRIEHKCDSSSGSSGSPLLHRRSDGSVAVVGVHTGTAEDGSTSYAALMGGERAVDDFIADGLTQDPAYSRSGSGYGPRML